MKNETNESYCKMLETVKNWLFMIRIDRENVERCGRYLDSHPEDEKAFDMWDSAVHELNVARIRYDTIREFCSMVFGYLPPEA